MRNYINEDLDKVYELCKLHGKNVTLIIKEGATYKSEQIISLYNALNINAAMLKGFDVTIKMSLSRRKALIVFLQEYFYDLNEYPNGVNIKEFEAKARNRFIILNRSVGEFNTAQKIHPKRPREFYEDENYKMRQYKVAIEPLAIAPEAFFFRKESIESFIKNYEDLNE